MALNLGKIFILVAFWATGILSAGSFEIQHLATTANPCNKYSLVNSVDFHPSEAKFCATYTQGNRVVIYEKTNLGKIKTVQTLANPQALLSQPQHAVFSPNGKWIAVANWTNQTFTFYSLENDNSFSQSPAAVFEAEEKLVTYKPHGIAFSPNGQFLAIAYGAGSQYDRALAIFRFDPKTLELVLCSCLSGKNELKGVPKGITFTPDGKALLVTFSDRNSFVVFDVNAQTGKIAAVPRQSIHGFCTNITRPEDIKISPDGKICVVTNSEAHTLTFYPFDSHNNRVLDSKPVYTMAKKFHLVFPHGVAFSADGTLLAVTQFGPIFTYPKGDIGWDQDMDPHEAKVSLFKIDNK